jgi:pimeloyl-ACP methyl ester carboxylesterase
MPATRIPDPVPVRSSPLAKFLPKTLSATSWISPTRWVEQAIEHEMLKRPEAPERTVLGELDLPPETKHHRVVTDDGGEIHAVELGKGPPLVLLHGVLLSVATWPYQLSELSQHHRVIALDQRGHGRSKTGVEGINIARLGRDLLEVLDALDVHDAVLVGHSMGGMVSMHVATEHADELADHVSGLVLVATSGDPLVNLPGLPLAVKLISPWVRAWIELIRGRSTIASIPLLKYLAARVILGGSPSPSNIEFAKALITAANARILGSLWGELLVFDVTDSLGNVSLPTQVVVGDRDLLTPPWHALRIVSKIPNATLVRFADCGHMVMFERHREMNRIILTFASQVQSSSGGSVARRRIAKATGAQGRVRRPGGSKA